MAIRATAIGFDKIRWLKPKEIHTFSFLVLVEGFENKGRRFRGQNDRGPKYYDSLRGTSGNLALAPLLPDLLEKGHEISMSGQ